MNHRRKNFDDIKSFIEGGGKQFSVLLAGQVKPIHTMCGIPHGMLKLSMSMMSVKNACIKYYYFLIYGKPSATFLLLQQMFFKKLIQMLILLSLN